MSHTLLSLFSLTGSDHVADLGQCDGSSRRQRNIVTWNGGTQLGADISRFWWWRSFSIQ
jgi:hypothetical protein